MTNWLLTTTYLAILGVFLVSTRVRLGRYAAINTLLTVVWVAVGIYSQYAHMNTLRPSDVVHAQVLGGLIAFNLVYLLGTRRGLAASVAANFAPEGINHRRVFALEALALLLLLPNVVESVPLLLSSGFDLKVVRDATYIQQRFDSHILAFVSRAVPKGLMQFVNILAAMNVARGSGRFALYAMLNVVILALTFGDRTAALAVVIYLISAIFLSPDTRRGRVKALVVSAFVTCSMIVVTALRGTGLESLSSSIALYFAGGMSFLTLILNQPDLFGFGDGLTWGYLTLGFIFDPLVLLLKSFGFAAIDIPSYHFNIFAQTFHDIGQSETMWFNNNTTAFYVFIRDFGWAGGIVGFALLAVATIFVERRAASSGWIGWHVSYLYISYVALISIMYYSALSTVWAIMMICAWWVGRGSPQRDEPNSTPLVIPRPYSGPVTVAHQASRRGGQRHLGA